MHASFVAAAAAAALAAAAAAALATAAAAALAAAAAQGKDSAWRALLDFLFNFLLFKYKIYMKHRP